ncbi:50S ribosomal protein L10 [Calidifontibacter sp. DB0510]|uniref:Large ribosomal subunit protein uL10 n=1 Tax=Metallococcus carri TaxID=1656884 RepID=A0A967E9U6_9MICO|nr:50S ribosomal protein L10 [Metallococcus carri]NHN55204.1 50S ribosomal protein L10 [Metallococcus carri]NOP36281.1 50S ribosomal protein L10 [Calidifontibacter sp. DB2511S]
MPNPSKQAAISELTENFRNSGAAVLTEYRGLSVAQLTELRNSLREHATYAVVKNTLTQRAAKEAGVSAFDDQLVGPSAIAFVTGDPVEAAKSLRDFAKANPLLVIKGGVLDGKALSAEEITKLASLESREVLLAKLAGAMKASLSQAVYLFAAPLSKTARAVDALRAKVEAEGPATPESDTTEAPAADATDEAPATDAAAEAPAADAEATTDVAEGGDES